MDKRHDMSLGLGQARLLVEGRGNWVYTHPLGEADRLVIGRGHENDIDLNDLHVSGEHAEIALADGKWFVRDLGSRNGTYLNRKKITEAELRHKDRIRIGTTSMTFLMDADASFAAAEPLPLVKMADAPPTPGEMESESSLEGLEEKDLRRELLAAREKIQRLTISAEFARRLARSPSPLAMVAVAMRFIARAVEAENGFIMQIDPVSEKWAVRARHGRILDWSHTGEEEAQTQAPMSLTIVERVIHSAEPLNSGAPMDDPRLDGALSVGALGIQSCLCAPLLKSGAAVGVVYVDRRQRMAPFTPAQEAVFMELTDQLNRIIYPDQMSM